MSNLYKQRYIVTNSDQCRVINSNQVLAEKMEELAKAAKMQETVSELDIDETEGFVEGIFAETIETDPEEENVRAKACEEADELIQAAQDKALEIIEEAKQEAILVAENARKAGEKEGYENGLQNAEQVLQEEREKLEEYRGLLEQEYQQKQRDLEPEIVDAVCGVIEKVFHVQFDDKKAILLHLVKNTIMKVENTKEFSVRVSPKNYAYIEEHRQEILAQVGQAVQLTVEVDATMEETQCMIETDSGFFECGIDIQMENLLKAIRSLSM